MVKELQTIYVDGNPWVISKEFAKKLIPSKVTKWGDERIDLSWLVYDANGSLKGEFNITVPSDAEKMSNLLKYTTTQELVDALQALRINIRYILSSVLIN